MTDTPKPIKWHTVNEDSARVLTIATNSPGVVYPLTTSALPDQMKIMPGVSSYYVSGYVSSLPTTQGLTVGGEMLIARSDGATTKNYNYVFATSSNGGVCFAGPFKGFGHHVTEGQSVAVNSLFGNTPFGKSGS